MQSIMIIENKNKIDIKTVLDSIDSLKFLISTNVKFLISLYWIKLIFYEHFSN
jgi:hypothetical protein